MAKKQKTFRLSDKALKRLERLKDFGFNNVAAVEAGLGLLLAGELYAEKKAYREKMRVMRRKMQGDAENDGKN